MAVTLSLHGVQSNGMVHEGCGTPQYVAPELFTTSPNVGYDPFKADVWSLCVIFFVMLAGAPPSTTPP